MRKITDLINFITPTVDNVFGRLKDTTFLPGGAVDETGSKVKTDWLMDVLSVPYKIAADKGLTLTGVADDTSSSQAYDLVFGEVTDYVRNGVNPAVRMLSMYTWSSSDTDDGGPNPGDGEYFFEAASKDGLTIFMYISSGLVMVASYIRGFFVSNVSTGILTSATDGFGLAVNPAVFVTTIEQTTPIDPRCWTSPDGLTWTQYKLELDTSRPGGRVVELVGNNLVIVAYEDADNSFYISADNGVTWTRTGGDADTPLYKPLVSASSGEDMVWVDADGAYVRHYSATGVWVTCSVVGGTIGATTNKQIVHAGYGRYLIRDDQPTLFLSAEGDPTTFNAIVPPLLGDTPTLLLGGDGVVGVIYDTGYYVATTDNAAIGAWERLPDVPKGVDPGMFATVSTFDGAKQLVAGSRNETTPGAFAGRTAPVQLP